MLTKKEREAIAARANTAACNMSSIFKILHGYNSSEHMSLKDYFIAMTTRILDLCDTSNMVELPLDKDGKVIKLDDTVYSKYGTESIVDCISYYKDRVTIATHTTDEFESDVYYGLELTHKKPVTTASLVKELTNIVAADYGTPMVVKRKISEIADQLKKLGDSDD